MQQTPCAVAQFMLGGKLVLQLCMWSILLGHSATAQHPATGYGVWSAPRSQSGGEIISFPSDLFMGAAEEKQLWALLFEHSDDDWTGITPQVLADQLSERVYVYLDRDEVELEGCGLNEPLIHGYLPPGPLGFRMRRVLHGSYLDFVIDAGGLVITSRGNADDNPQIRVYDVTPLVKRQVGGRRLYDYGRLTDLIFRTVEPSSWELNGGTNTIASFTRSEGDSEIALLTIACATSVHLRIQPLLNRLNGHFVAADRSVTPVPSQSPTGNPSTNHAPNPLPGELQSSSPEIEELFGRPKPEPFGATLLIKPTPRVPIVQPGGMF